jgi:hypothetical protein
MARRARSKNSRPARLPRGPLVRVLAYTLLIALLAGAGYVGARSAWAAVVARPQFRLDLQAFTLGDSPQWVNADAMSRQLRLQLAPIPAGVSVFQRDLTGAVYQQLSGCPYLLRVQAVERRLPNTLLVEASFRKPAGVAIWGNGHYMLDEDGVPLPEKLFNPPAEWLGRPLPVIEDKLLSQPPPVGRVWGWPRLAVGARLCEYLRQAGLFERLPVTSIDVTGVGRQSRGSADAPDIILTTAGGAQVKWGASSVYTQVGMEEPAFLIPDAEKLQVLLAKLADYPNLQGIQYLDLRFHGKVYFRESN